MPPRYDTAWEPCPLSHRAVGQAFESWGPGKLQSLVREGHGEVQASFPIPFWGCCR